MRIPVFYGSYRRDRQGIRLARWIVAELTAAGHEAELVDAMAIDLPMLDRMYKEHEAGSAPPALEALAGTIRAADAFLFVVGEYNWGPQPGLKNLTDHFLEEWFWRPAALASYSAGRFAGVRAATAWRPILNEMGMVTISSTLTVGGIGDAFDGDDRPDGPGGKAAADAWPRFLADLIWWAEAAQAQRERADPPY